MEMNPDKKEGKTKKDEDRETLMSVIRTAYSLQHTTTRFGNFCGGMFMMANLILNAKKEITIEEILAGLEERKLIVPYVLLLYHRFKEWYVLEGRQEQDRDKDFQAFLGSLKKILKKGENFNGEQKGKA